MKRLLAAILVALIALGPAAPATASGEGGGGESRDPVQSYVNRTALALTMSQILFTPSQIILLSKDGAFGMFPPEDIEKIEEPGGGGLLGKLFNANKKKIFENLEQRNFLKKVGRAYRIGDMVFVDTNFFNTTLEADANAAGRAALQHILNGNTFLLGPARNPFDAIMEQQILALLFFMRSPERIRTIYRLDPVMSETGDIEDVSTSAATNQPIAFLAFFAAIASGRAQPIGNVWQIGDQVVVAAPLEELFPPE